MKKFCATVALTGALSVSQGMAVAAPSMKWPTFDRERLQQIVGAFAAEGVTACPDEVRNTPDITGRSGYQAIDLYARTRWPSCPQHRPVEDPNYNLDEERAALNYEGLLDIDFYTSQKAFARGVRTWKRTLLNWPIVGWSWKPVVLGLNAGYPDVVKAVLKAMKELPGHPKELFDNRWRQMGPRTLRARPGVTGCRFSGRTQTRSLS